MKNTARVPVLVVLVLATTIAVLASTVVSPGLAAGTACTNTGWRGAFVSCAFAQSAQGIADDPAPLPSPDPVTSPVLQSSPDLVTSPVLQSSPDLVTSPVLLPTPVPVTSPILQPSPRPGPRPMVGWR